MDGAHKSKCLQSLQQLFLSGTTAKSLNNYAAQKPDLSDLTRQELLAFLSETESEGYASASGDMVGIL